MARYFIEFGPEHNRTFIEKPPANPLGPVVEVNEADLKVLRRTHPKHWKRGKKGVSVGRLHVAISHRERNLRLLCLVLGLVLGVSLTLLLR